MNINYLNKLEYNKVLELLSSFCLTYLGSNLSLNLLPSNEKTIVEHTLSETREAVNLIYRISTPPFYDISNITLHTKILESGNSLSFQGLLDLANIFKLAQELKDYFYKDFLDFSEFPILSSYFFNLYCNKNVTDKIFSCIIDENTIDDKASNSLYKIRKKKKQIEQDIRAKLNEIIHSSHYSKFIQENIVTIRNDRFVIPVKEEFRTQMKGFVHDISNAGSTVFIEPISVFDMNNELSQLKADEEFEIEKILQSLTNLFSPYINELKKDCEIIGNLDFIFAKAKFSNSLDGITPIINDKKSINLINARHPLIDKKIVVPININIGTNFSTLVITGPNTGGKTVTLKTVGLLTCMACSGLNIPANTQSSIYVFDNIFADIGDDQSISDSLSTFSSHMLNIIDITHNATSNSLILVDELGSGTDPLEGANLAISILNFFKRNGSLTIATTHYQELKKYALISDGFENASVEFDISTLSPTYRLLIGVPGKSNAFEISQKLGLDNNIINEAKSFINNNDSNFEELMKNIYNDKITIENAKENIEKELNNIQLLKKSLEKDNTELENQSKQLIKDAKIEARNILLQAKEEANNIIKQMNSNLNLKELNEYRNKLNSNIKKLSTYNIDNNFKTHNHHSNNSQKEAIYLKPEHIQPHTQVYIPSFGQNGTILSHISKSNEVQVQIGNIKTNINIKYLQPIQDTNSVPKNVNIISNTYNKISKSKNIKTEINVIGYNVEDAIFVVDKFLDDCSLSKLQTARIVHGKGTGKLKTGIHKFLKNNPHVKSFRLGTFGEGEDGVTIVELK